MAALRSLTSDERQQILDDLAETRRLRIRYASALVNAPDSDVLKLQVSACDTWIARYEAALRENARGLL